LQSKTQRSVGIGLVVVAALIAILSLKSTANLGIGGTAPILMLLGVVLIRRAKQKHQ